MNAKILVYISSAREVPRREGGSNPAGIALGELIESLKPLIQAGYTLDGYTSIHQAVGSYQQKSI